MINPRGSQTARAVGAAHRWTSKEPVCWFCRALIALDVVLLTGMFVILGRMVWVFHAFWEALR